MRCISRKFVCLNIFRTTDISKQHHIERWTWMWVFEIFFTTKMWTKSTQLWSSIIRLFFYRYSVSFLSVHLSSYYLRLINKRWSHALSSRKLFQHFDLILSQLCFISFSLSVSSSSLLKPIYLLIIFVLKSKFICSA